MSFQDKDIFTFLDAQGGAYAAVSGGVVVHLSPAAGELLGDVLGKPAREVFDEVLLPPSPPGANGTAAGVPVSGADLGELRILTLRPVAEESRNAVELFSMALRGALGDGDVTVGRMEERFRRQGDLEGLARLSELELSHAKIARTVNNFERLFGEDVWRPKMRLLSLETLIGDLVTTVGLLTRDRGVEIKAELAQEKRYFYGDRRLLELALLNLISNSLHALPNGGTVTVSLSCTDAEAAIRVSDTGGGVAPGKLATAFRAHSAPPSFTDSGFGAGLGLGVVQRVAGIHAGAAMIESRPGSGSCVCLLLPYRDAPEEYYRAPGIDDAMTMREVITELSDVLTSVVFKDI